MIPFKNSRIKKMILLANLAAVAIVLGIVESRLEIAIVPGAKLGLANLITLIVLYLFSFKEAFIVTIVRILMVGILSGVLGPPFWMGFAGGIFSVTIMSLFKKAKLSTTLVSLFGSIAHQIGQILVGVQLLGGKQIAYYLYIMIPLGVVSGIAIGFIAEKFLINYNKRFEME